VRGRLLALTDRLPGPVRAAGKRAATVVSMFMPDIAASPSSDRNPFALVSRNALKAIYLYVRLNPMALLQISAVRQRLARERLRVLEQQRGFTQAGDSAHVAFNAVEHNLEGAKSAPDLDRPNILVNVVSSIEQVWKNIKNLDVLSIGPRSEIEIFALIAAGFNEARIRAIDLFSYSPWVETGNMHAMPYGDGAFDVVLLGWVLAYSTDPAAAGREVVRVCRDGAVVAVAADYPGERVGVSKFNNQETRIASAQQLLGYFDGHVDYVYFRHDPELPARQMAMAVFRIRKPPATGRFSDGLASMTRS
jgi:SAM-dependent methyltransferase